MLALSGLYSIGSVKSLVRNNPWFSDEFKLDNPPSQYDAGGRKLFNLEIVWRDLHRSLICSAIFK